MRATVVPLCLALAGGCASGESVYRDPQENPRNIARALGCGTDQVAVCVESNCELEDYFCAEQGELRSLFDPRTDR